jgi:ABC-type uncharacterized transport system involved in gliding motility auxiliary subunit
MKATLKFLLKYLIFLGIGLVSAGLMAGFIAGNWDNVATGLIVVGVVLMGVWLLFLGRMGDPEQPNFWQRRSTQVGTNALVSTVSVLVILGLVNFVAVQHQQKIDLTETQLFSLAPETTDVLKTLKEPVNLYLFTTDRNPGDQGLLETFQRQNKNFKFEYVDPQTMPDLAQKLQLKNDPVSKDVYIERFSREKNQSFQQFVQIINPSQRLSESKLTNALVRLTSDRQPKIYFLQGHGERPIEAGDQSLTQAVKALRDRNFVVEPLSLLQSAGVPSDAAAVVIAGPKQVLLEPEVKLLEDYQARSGNLLVLLDPRVKTGLDALLQKWGVILDDRLALDASKIREQMKLGPASPIVNRYSEHPITRTFRNSISFYPYARPLEIKEVPGVRPNPIVITNDETWAEAHPEEKPIKFNEGDRRGPLAIGVALSRVTTPNAEARLVVFGSVGFAIDGYFNQAINGDMVINSVSWLSQDSSQLMSVRSRDVRSRRIIPTPALVTGLFLAAVVIVPLLGLLAAAILWWRRR